MGLEQWGASEQYYKIASGYLGYELGRVISQEKDLFRVVMDKEECLARVSGKFRYDVSAISEFPSVGDFVLVEHSFKGDVAVIQKVLPRKSVFIRKAAGKNCMEQVIATNIDTVFLCMALNRDFNIRRLERYLSIAWDSGAVPVIILTKIDLMAARSS
ncbi:MAG: GTPase RsgA [Lachnospiraceae bacterium]